MVILAEIFLTNFAIYLPYFFVFQLVSWSVIAYFTEFYEVYRFTKPAEILAKLVKQFTLFTLVVIAYFSVAREIIPSFSKLLIFIGFTFVYITLFKGLLFYYLKKYRIVLGGNFRRAIIIGHTESAIDLKDLFVSRPDYGYRFFGFFSDKVVDKDVIGRIKEVQDYVLANKIDDIYCALQELSEEELKELVEFSDYHRKTIKFIPEGSEIYSKNLQIDYYEFFPVLSLKRTSFERFA